MTSTSRFITAAEIAADCGISTSKAYDIIRQLNEELAAKGYITIRGKTNRRYYERKTDFAEPADFLE